MLKKISTVGDSYIVCDFGEKVALETNSQVIKLFYCIKNLSENKSIKGLLNCTPSYNKLLIHFNLEETKADKVIEDIKLLKEYGYKLNSINTCDGYTPQGKKKLKRRYEIGHSK